MRLPKPKFLAKGPYRVKRLRDGARLLPVFALFLTILPMLWSPIGQGRALSQDLFYFFGLWLVLVLVAALFARGLMRRGKDNLADRLADLDED